MADTESTLPGNGTAGPFNYTFPALEAAHVKVSVDNVAKTVGVDYSLDFVQKEITFLVAPYPTAAQTIRIYRVTDDTALEATFYSGAAIRATDLNNNFNQALYVAQETSNNSVQDVGNVSLNGNYTFNGTASGQTPTANSNFATKQYVDDAAFASGNLTVGNKGDITVNSATSWTLNQTYLTSAAVGVTVPGLAVASTYTAQQTFAELKETVYTLATTGSIALDPANGSIQSSVLTGAPTFTDSLEAGQCVVLMLEGGASYTVTWPTITWVTSGGNVAPTLTAKDTLVLWKVSTTLYGAYVGSYV
jgi:hypothetical protein